MKTAIYIRVSTEEQAIEGYSISAQKDRLKAYCISQDMIVHEFYVDEGISAKDMNRPRLQDMIDDIKQGKIDCVLVYRLDRLTRSVLDLYTLLEIFDKHECKFKSATEVYDTTTAMGRLFITLVAALAQWERENTGERVRMGLAEKVRQGKYAHVIEPFGYNLDRSTSTLTINEKEADLYRFIVDMYLNKNMGVSRICKYLNEHNYTTKKDNSWNDKPLMQILKNPLYKGTIRWGQEHEQMLLVPGYVPPIISEEVWNDIQKTIEDRKGTPPRTIANDYVFSGLFRCDKCGCAVTGSKTYYKNKHGERVIYKTYRCINRKSGQCTNGLQFSEKKVEQLFLKEIKRLIAKNEAKSKKHIENFSQIYLSKNKDNTEEKIIKLENELKKIRNRKKKWQYAWAEEKISDQDFEERMNEENSKEQKTKEEISKIGSTQKVKKVSEKDLIKNLKEIERNWKNLDVYEKKSIANKIIKKMVFTDDKSPMPKLVAIEFK